MAHNLTLRLLSHDEHRMLSLCLLCAADPLACGVGDALTLHRLAMIGLLRPVDTPGRNCRYVTTQDGAHALDRGGMRHQRAQPKQRGAQGVS